MSRSFQQECQQPMIMRYDPETGDVGPFPFTPFPVIPGRQLDYDIELLRALAAEGLNIEPTFTMLLFMGVEAFELFLRRADTRVNWTAFRKEFARRHPVIAARLGRARAEVDALRDHQHTSTRPFTVPEVIVGAGLLAMLPRIFQVRADIWLPGQPFRCDYEVRLTGAGPADCVRVEISGMVDALGRARTETGARYAARQPARLAAYALAGISPPIVVHADELWSRKALAAIFRKVRNQLLAPYDDQRPHLTGFDKQMRRSRDHCDHRME